MSHDSGQQTEVPTMQEKYNTTLKEMQDFYKEKAKRRIDSMPSGRFQTAFEQAKGTIEDFQKYANEASNHGRTRTTMSRHGGEREMKNRRANVERAMDKAKGEFKIAHDSMKLKDESERDEKFIKLLDWAVNNLGEHDLQKSKQVLDLVDHVLNSIKGLMKFEDGMSLLEHMQPLIPSDALPEDVNSPKMALFLDMYYMLESNKNSLNYWDEEISRLIEIEVDKERPNQSKSKRRGLSFGRENDKLHQSQDSNAGKSHGRRTTTKVKELTGKLGIRRGH